MSAASWTGSFRLLRPYEFLQKVTMNCPRLDLPPVILTKHDSLPLRPVQQAGDEHQCALNAL